MSIDFSFHRETPEPTEAQLLAAYPDLPPGLTAADDVALWHGLGKGLGFEDIAVKRGVHPDKLRARFFAFRDAQGGGMLSLKAQRVFLEEAERRLSRG